MKKYYLSNKERSLHNIKNVKNLFLLITLLIFICALVISPDKYIKVTFNGIIVWATAILPALFPFMLFTKLLTLTGYVEQVSKGLSKLTNKLYKVPGISAYVFLMSIITGYPLGAKITADLYEEGVINRSQAHRICAFTSNSGPMFIVGTVGVGMLISPTAGYILLLSHILASIINGLIYRNYNPKELDFKAKSNNKTSQDSESDILTKSMQNSISSVLLIGGYITIFFVITEILSSLQIFYPITNLFSLIGIEESITKGVLFGFFEITKGCLTIAQTSVLLPIKISLCSLIISFGGFSTAFQSFAFLNKFKISKKFFFLQKISHAILSLLLTALFLLII
jgi:sporulation integral membrane protein YlbJ